jgi:hypothetical protein
MPFGRPRASSCPSGEVVPSISFLPLMVGNCVLCALYPPPLPITHPMQAVIMGYIYAVGNRATSSRHSPQQE